MLPTIWKKATQTKPNNIIQKYKIKKKKSLMANLKIEIN